MSPDNSNAFSPQNLTRTEDQNQNFPNAQGQVIPSAASEPEEAQEWQTPMAKPEGGWKQEGTPLTIKARPEEVNKILNSKHVLSDVDTSDPSNARVFVANFLNSKYNEDKRGIYKDYEGKTKTYGLSGDPVADAKSILDGDTKIHESSLTRIAKDRKVIAEGLDKLGYEERQSFGANAKNTFDRGFLDLGVGTAAQGTLKGIESMGDEMERIERGLFEDMGIKYYDDELGDPLTSEDVLKWREDVRERNAVDPEFLNSYTGGVIQGYGQAAAIVPAFLLNPAVGTGMSVAQAYQYGEDGYRDFVKSKGIKYEESEARKAGLWNMPSAAVDVIANRFAIGKILKPLKGAKITKGGALEFLKDTAESAAMGSGTEGVQTVWENLNAKYLSGYDRDKVLTDGVVDAMVIGAFVDSTITAGGQGVTKGVNKLLGKTMDPVDGMSAVDMALAANIVPEPEFKAYIEEIYGDQTTEEGVPLQELAIKARQGDRKAAEELVEALTVEASQAAVEAGLTAEEAEARGKEAAEVADPIEPLVETAIDKEISTKKEELAALEEAKESTPEDMKKYEKLDKEIQALETKRIEETVNGKLMTPFTRGVEAEKQRVEQERLDKADMELEEQSQVADLISKLTPLSEGSTVENAPELSGGGPAIIQGWKDAGFTKEEIEIKSKELATQQGMPNVRLEDMVQRGSQKSTKTDGSPIQSLIRLFKGANPFTVVEEFAHAEYDREIAEGTVTVEQIREWRKAIEELTDTPDLRGETDEDIKEWVAEQVKARIYGQRNDLSLPESFKKFLDDIISKFKQILGRAAELKDLEAKNQLPEGFLDMLDRQGLVGKKQVGSTTVTTNAQTRTFPTEGGGVVGPASFSLESFQGSPTSGIRKMDTAYMGTGEGAQAFGWGIYSAQAKTLAEHYRDVLSGKSLEGVDGRPFLDLVERPGAKKILNEISFAVGLGRPLWNQVLVLEKRVANAADWTDRGDNIEENKKFVADANEALEALKAIKTSEGSLYRLELNVEQDELLDWDKPLSEQSELVLDALSSLSEKYDLSGKFSNPESYAGGEIYSAIGDLLSKNGYMMEEDQRAVSEALAAAGIKGIRYLDGDSRSDGEGTSNYVMFSGDDITVTHENGEVVDTSTDSSFSLEEVDANRSVSESVYLRNSSKFQEKVENGTIKPQTPISTFTGSEIFLHAPDFAFAGTASVEGKNYAEGKGGVYYPVLFDEGTNFWASTRSAAKKMASDLNKIGEKNNGKILMGLVSSPADKMFSSTTISRSVVKFFNIIAENPRKYGIKKPDLNRLIVAASKSAKDKGKTFKRKLKIGTGIDGNVTEIQDLLNADDSTFGLRKSFVEELAAGIAGHLKSQDESKSSALAGALLGAENLHAKNAIVKGKLSKASILQGLGEQMSEGFTKGLHEIDSKMIYAVIEYDGRVEAVATPEHESYPYAIRGMDGGDVVVNVLDKAHPWNEAVEYSEDVEFKDDKNVVTSSYKAGESINPDDLGRVMPASAGVTFKPLRVVEPSSDSTSIPIPSYSLEPVTPEQDYEIESVYDEDGEIDYDVEEALRKIAKERDLGITSDREANSVVRNDDGEVIGGTFVSNDGDNYTFDVVVSEAADGTGVGSKLLDDVIEMPYELRDINPDATMQVDVVSPKMKEMLERRGFEVKEEIGKDRWLMEPKDYDNVGKPKVVETTSADPRISFSLEPVSEQDGDAEATVAAEERQSRTPERQAFIDYQRELRRSQTDNTEEEKAKLQELLKVATDADEIDKLKQEGDKKLIAVIEKKIKQIRKQADEREDVTESVKALERLINSPEVPMEVRARMRGFGRLTERKTPQGKARWVEQMSNKLEAEIDRHYRTRNVRTLRSLLRPFATEYSPNRRKLKERVGEEARSELNFAQRLLNNSEATPPVNITDERRNELIDIFGDVGNRQSSPTRVKAALNIAGKIAQEGRTARDDFKDQRRERNEKLGDLVRDEVLNGEEAMGKSQIAAREKQRNVFLKGYDATRAYLIRGMEGFQQQLNKLDSIKGGILESAFLPAVYQADQNEKALNREHVERVNEDFKTVLGSDDRQAASWYKNSRELHDTDIEWIEDKAIGMEKRTISKQQGVSVLMQWLDPSLRPTFSNMGINEATIEQIKVFIGEIGVSEAYYFRERYAEMGIALNAKHMEVEGIPLDMIDGYGGRARRINSVGSRQEDMQMFSTDSSGRPTVKSGSMKERTNSTDYLIFQDASSDFAAHAREVNHYISHAELAKNLSAAFLNNARARNAIKQKHGSDFYDSLKDQVEAIIEGDPKVMSKTDSGLNWLRSNVTKASLMVKPAILIKQLTSAPSFIEEIGPVAYAKASTSLTRNARKFMPMIWNSEYVKNRMSNSQYADIQQSLDQRDNTLKGLRWDDYAMMNVKVGDIGAVIAGGAPVYVHAYNEAKAAGMTNDQAQAKAEEVFGLASERAQQSSATHAKGAFLRGAGIARTWFMYLTSPLQYQRNVNTSIANLVANVFENKSGRKSEVKKAANQALRAIVIYHVILPQIFQAVASGLVGFTDDEDYIKEQFWAKQRRALYMGNLNSLPIAGKFISILANLAAGTGESFGSSGSPIVDLYDKIASDFERALKDGEDVSKLLKFSEGAGLVVGIPVKTVKSYYDAITDISEGNTEHPLLRAGGWSSWSIFED